MLSSSTISPSGSMGGSRSLGALVAESDGPTQGWPLLGGQHCSCPRVRVGKQTGMPAWAVLESQGQPASLVVGLLVPARVEDWENITEYPFCLGLLAWSRVSGGCLGCGQSTWLQSPQGPGILELFSEGRLSSGHFKGLFPPKAREIPMIISSPFFPLPKGLLR